MKAIPPQNQNSVSSRRSKISEMVQALGNAKWPFAIALTFLGFQEHWLLSAYYRERTAAFDVHSRVNQKHHLELVATEGMCIRHNLPKRSRSFDT